MVTFPFNKKSRIGCLDIGVVDTITIYMLISILKLLSLWCVKFLVVLWSSILVGVWRSVWRRGVIDSTIVSSSHLCSLQHGLPEVDSSTGFKVKFELGLPWIVRIVVTSL